MSVWTYLHFLPLAAALLLAVHAAGEKLRADHRLIKAFAKIPGQASVGFDRIQRAEHHQGNAVGR
ncbi:MAG: hypothetical protein QHH06_15440 [Clostridiales bacterium]|nr:hypothetical protein [Eubacteriales bacterium]MDH7567829.1 hypothetical protein [Clostridiales bacterium]